MKNISLAESIFGHIILGILALMCVVILGAHLNAWTFVFPVGLWVFYSYYLIKRYL
jgi:hypothetical protein